MVWTGVGDGADCQTFELSKGKRLVSLERVGFAVIPPLSWGGLYGPENQTSRSEEHV